MAAMAGLGLLLETPTAAQQLRRPAAPAQIISKAAAVNAAGKNDVDFAFSCSSSSSRAPAPVPVTATASCSSSFLQRCFLCRRELADGRDIYIYRGDRAFCSEECRCRHILVEDDDDCARVAAADRSRRRRRQAVAGGFAF